MTAQRTHFLLQRALLIVLASSAWVSADAGIRDDGHLFGDEAVAGAQETIQQVHRRFGAEVLVETLDRVPAQCAGKMHSEGADRFFAKWAKKRAGRASGIYVLVVREPAVVRVALGKGAVDWRLGDEQAVELREMVAGAVRKGDFDEGLTNGVAYVNRTIAQTWGAGGAQRAGMDGQWMGMMAGLGLTVLGAWGLVRRAPAGE